MSDKNKKHNSNNNFHEYYFNYINIKFNKRRHININIRKEEKLATFPKLSLSKIFDNSFSDEFEKYTMDQFIKGRIQENKDRCRIQYIKKKDVNNLYEYNNIIIKTGIPIK